MLIGLTVGYCWHKSIINQAQQPFIRPAISERDMAGRCNHARPAVQDDKWTYNLTSDDFMMADVDEKATVAQKGMATTIIIY